MEYLSPEWFQAANAALEAANPVDASVSVGYQVTGGPSGDFVYRLELGPERVQFISDPEAKSSSRVFLELTWPVAVAIAKRERNAANAVLEGSVKLHGNVETLLVHARTLSEMEDWLAPIGSETIYSIS